MIRQRLQNMQVNLDLPTENAMLTYLFKRVSALPAGKRSAAIDRALAATGKTGDDAVNALVHRLMTTTLADAATRMAAFGEDEATLAARKDPMLNLAMEIAVETRTSDEADRAIEGQMLLVGPRYMEALQAFRQHELYPDANSTLRFTYATVKGFAPRDAVVYKAFTTLAGVLEKCTDEEPFNCPAGLILAAKIAPSSGTPIPGSATYRPTSCRPTTSPAATRVRRS